MSLVYRKIWYFILNVMYVYVNIVFCNCISSERAGTLKKLRYIMQIKTGSSSSVILLACVEFQVQSSTAFSWRNLIYVVTKAYH
jgi:hypothetical protein